MLALICCVPAQCDSRLSWEGPLKVYYCMISDTSDVLPSPEVARYMLLACGSLKSRRPRETLDKHDQKCFSAARPGQEPSAASSNEEEDDQADSLEQAARSASQLPFLLFNNVMLCLETPNFTSYSSSTK